MRILITGGVRSGKSRFALELAEKHFSSKNFLATAIAFDEEMQERIRNHRKERGEAFTTIEEPIEIHTALCENVILDDITVWLNNLFFREQSECYREILAELLRTMPQNIIIITNETGMGNIPADAYTRRYNRLLGEINMELARAVDQLFFMVSGYPIQIK